MKLLLWKFVHGTTAVLFWHVQNFVVIWIYTKINFPLNLNYDGNMVLEMGTRSVFKICYCHVICNIVQGSFCVRVQPIRDNLTHWGRVTHICVGNLIIIGSDNGLSPERRQAIIWTNAGILSIGPSGTNFNEILIGIQTFSLKKMHFKMSSAKWRPFCLGLNVLTPSLIGWAPTQNYPWLCYDRQC